MKTLMTGMLVLAGALSAEAQVRPVPIQGPIAPIRGPVIVAPPPPPPPVFRPVFPPPPVLDPERLRPRPWVR